MQPGYPGSGQDPYGQQPPYSDPYGQPQYSPQQPQEPQEPQQPDAPAYPPPGQQSEQPPQYQDPYAQPSAGGPQPTSGGPYPPPGAGYPNAPQYPAAGYGAPMGAPPQQSNTQGVLALIFGILGLVLSLCCWPVGLLFDIAAGALGFVGLNRAKQGLASNRGMALAGVILGVVGLLIAIVLAILQVSGALGSFSQWLQDQQPA